MPATDIPDIPVTAAEIIRQVGHGAYSRGQNYMRAGNVVRYRYETETRVLTGTVVGTAPSPYLVVISFNDAESSYAFNAGCTCPVATDCKHAVAVMLNAIDQSAKAKRALTASSNTWKPGNQKSRLDQEELRRFGVFAASQLEQEESKVPAWRRTLSHTLAARPSGYTPPQQLVSGALDLTFTVPHPYGFNVGSQTRAPNVVLKARPLMEGARNNWIKGGLTWENFHRDPVRGAGGHRVFPEHHRWFAEFYSVVRPWQSVYSSHRDWVDLGPFLRLLCGGCCGGPRNFSTDSA